jgi:hypothetical protein
VHVMKLLDPNFSFIFLYYLGFKYSKRFIFKICLMSVLRPDSITVHNISYTTHRKLPVVLQFSEFYSSV